MTDQERYDLLGEVLHDMKKEMLKIEMNMKHMNAATTRGKLAGTMNAEAEQINNQNLMMLQMSYSQMPDMIAVVKEMQFKAYEKLHESKA